MLHLDHSNRVKKPESFEIFKLTRKEIEEIQNRTEANQSFLVAYVICADHSDQGGRIIKVIPVVLFRFNEFLYQNSWAILDTVLKSARFKDESSGYESYEKLQDELYLSKSSIHNLRVAIARFQPNQGVSEINMEGCLPTQECNLVVPLSNLLALLILKRSMGEGITFDARKFLVAESIREQSDSATIAGKRLAYGPKEVLIVQRKYGIQPLRLFSFFDEIIQPAEHVVVVVTKVPGRKKMVHSVHVRDNGNCFYPVYVTDSEILRVTLDPTSRILTINEKVVAATKSAPKNVFNFKLDELFGCNSRNRMNLEQGPILNFNSERYWVTYQLSILCGMLIQSATDVLTMLKT